MDLASPRGCDSHSGSDFPSISMISRGRAFPMGVRQPSRRDPGSEIDELVRRYQRKYPRLEYSQAFAVIRERHPELAQRYAAQRDAGLGRRRLRTRRPSRRYPTRTPRICVRLTRPARLAGPVTAQSEMRKRDG
jgi:hypothetical protein